MKSIARLIAIAAFSLSTAVLAQQGHEGHLPQADGVIKKIDAKAGALTIAHGPIANLNMPAMTMSFKAKTPDMLTKWKEGDKVRFRTADVSGALTVVSIEAAK